LAILEIRSLTTVFGPNPAPALQKLRSGASEEEILASGHVVALRDINLSISEGEIFVLMGPSGSGKSTLVRHCNRLIAQTEGQVFVQGHDLAKQTQSELRELRRTRISMVFQAFGLLPHRTVLDNVAFGLELKGFASGERRARAMTVIEQVGLGGSEARSPGELSGGMRQRVGLARALCCETPIVLMDEPFGALDPVIRESLQTDLLELQRKFGKTFVFITHDVDEAIRLGTRIGILDNGRLLQVGTPLEILLSPASPTVAGFVRHVNLARAIPLSVALEASTGDDLLPIPDSPVDHLLDASRPLEDALPHLLESTRRVGIHQDGRFLGFICRQRVIELLTRPSRVSS
jgi:glycine betaine/proline transport system ATP-binding protein